ncbi:hypothetical protein [Cerasicoccus frondis]|uniref:hypothetical protein n=1 Tax=Cerasicoccus frondis TaxID=490090 RepID=UPI0028524E30|nr:hypothetical protein [Cerasicoccus frondis]
MSDLEIIKRDVSELRHTVYGNGSPGIKTRVERIETRLDTGIKILWGLLILAVPSALTIVGMGLSFFIK